MDNRSIEQLTEEKHQLAKSIKRNIVIMTAQAIAGGLLIYVFWTPVREESFYNSMIFLGALLLLGACITLIFTLASFLSRRYLKKEVAIKESGNQEKKEQLDDATRKKIVILKILSYICGVGFIGGVLFVIIMEQTYGTRNFVHDGITLGLALLCFGCFVVMATYADKRMEGLKPKLIQEIGPEMFANFEYDPVGGISQNDFYKLGTFFFEEDYSDIKRKLARLKTSFVSENLISGVYKGIPFEQCNINIRTTSGNETMDSFSGRWIIFKFDKKFPLYLQLRGDGVSNKELFKEVTRAHSLEKYMSVPQKFRVRYTTYIRDLEKAKNFLVENIRGKLIELRRKTEDRQLVYIIFINNELHIGMKSGRSKKYKKKKEALKQAIRDEMKFIYDVVDILELDKVDNGKYLNFGHLK